MNLTSISKNNIIMYNKSVRTDEIETNIAESPKQENSINIKFSEAGKKKSREFNLQEELQKMESMVESLRRQAETARQQGEAMAEAFEMQRKCLLIAMRIMSGDKVPSEDHQFLIENNPGLYGKAVMMRRTKENPEEHKRVSEDKEASAEPASSEPAAESVSASGEAVQPVNAEITLSV